MSYDPKHRDSSWQMIAPGVYLDPENCSHIFPDEVLATLDLPYTRENWDIVVAALADIIREANPTITFELIHHTREADA